MRKKTPNMIPDVNVALRKGDFNLLRNLVESGADVNLKDEEERTPLINCCLHDGQKWAVGSARLLLTYGAKVGFCDKMGRNALMYAVLYQREELVKLFLEACDFDLTRADKWNHTALSYATCFGNTRVKTMLINILNKCHFISETSKKKSIVKEKNSFRLPPINYNLQTTPRTSNRPLNVTSICNSESKMNISPSEARYRGIEYTLPYNPIPADIWEKRMRLHSPAKQQYSNPCLLGDTKDMLSKNVSPKCGKTMDTKDKTGINPSDVKTKNEQSDWRKEFQNLIAMLEISISSSYCKGAKKLSLDQRTYPNIYKTELDVCTVPSIPKKGRRLSFDTMDVLFDKRSVRGIIRRRSSLSVIPLIKVKEYK
ncbi:tRNA (adenine(37)-N6)-methyltransferase [Pelobates cultripes]|uniref:tRNA (Adenine(37)-N6)-methyltransferase n=1 Tax=Pelobates cultripes TaxID=61616 RepID=A0AAD1S6A4_PELCU|nr:tRNA (adenine(37)-N6)-methyltransferase [Pelobates cultripes]